MSAPDIDDAFVTQFESEAHIEYQQMGSKLRNTVRTKQGVVGSSTTFQVIGNAAVGSKSREGNIPVTHVTHAPVACTLQDRYSGIYIDKLDELKVQHDERSAQSKNIGAAMGRDTDDIITTSMDTSGNAANVGTAATWTAASSPISIMEALGNASVQFDGEVYAVVPWGLWGDLLDIDEFSNSDYIGETRIWYEGVTAKDWLGMKWFPHENLPQDGSADTKAFFYHRSSIGHAIGSDFSLRMDFVPEKASTLVSADMSHGACMIDDTGCIEVLYNT
tara:strand:- start:1351 stop:2178 length:828 start_codon:yes stop_codon:yes gene_type:complete